MMAVHVDPQFRYRTLWLMIGYGLLAFIIYVSVVNVPVEIEIDLSWKDKLFHTLAYFVLMFWFVQIYHVTRTKLLFGVVFLVVGVMMEVIQGYMPERYFEYADMAANSLGVVIGLMLSMTSMRSLLSRFERSFL